MLVWCISSNKVKRKSKIYADYDRVFKSLSRFCFLNCSLRSDTILQSLFVPGPAHWGGYCKTGKKQSPIDIESAKATYDKNLGAFKLTNYDKILNVNFSIENNGHALTVGLSDGDYKVSEGGLTSVYKTVQFHFHWGSSNTVGSEHTVNGKQYAAEVS